MHRQHHRTRLLWLLLWLNLHAWLLLLLCAGVHCLLCCGGLLGLLLLLGAHSA
jgi:hypothetical protein